MSQGERARASRSREGGAGAAGGRRIVDRDAGEWRVRDVLRRRHLQRHGERLVALRRLRRADIRILRALAFYVAYGGESGGQRQAGGGGTFEEGLSTTSARTGVVA